MNFVIDENFLTSVTIRKEWGRFDHIPDNELTDEQLVIMIKGEDRCASTSSDDHPEFKKLRFMLGERGFINIQQRWWNGDTVLKPFTLNGAQFDINEQFPSGAAIKSHVRYLKNK